MNWQIKSDSMQIQLPMMYPLFYPDTSPIGISIGNISRFMKPVKPPQDYSWRNTPVYSPIPKTKPRLTARITPTYVLIRFVEHIKRTGQDAGNAPKLPLG